MSMRAFLQRLAMPAILVAVSFLALTPGEAGTVIASGELRHALAFGILPLLMTLAYPRLPGVALWLLLAAFGGAIEVAQGAMEMGRHPEWQDFRTDLLFATAGTLASRLLARWLRGAPDADRVRD